MAVMFLFKYSEDGSNMIQSQKAKKRAKKK